MRDLVLLGPDLGYRPTTSAPQPVGERSDKSVGNPQHDRDKEDAHEELPVIGKPASAQQELEPAHQEGAKERSDQGCAPAHGRPDHALDRKYGPGVEERDDTDPSGVHGAGSRRHESGDAEHED